MWPLGRCCVGLIQRDNLYTHFQRIYNRESSRIGETIKPMMAYLKPDGNDYCMLEFCRLTHRIQNYGHLNTDDVPPVPAVSCPYSDIYPVQQNLDSVCHHQNFQMGIFMRSQYNIEYLPHNFSTDMIASGWRLVPHTDV